MTTDRSETTPTSEPPMLTSEQRQLGRRWNIVILVTILLAFMFAMHATMELTGGDWDFWSDWKDRVYYPLVMAASLIPLLAAVQYVFWRLFRIPGATILALTGELIYHWPRTFLNFHLFTAYPLNFVWPSVVIPGAILLDVVFMLTRKWILTALLGGALFGVLFYVQNKPALALFHQPVVEFHKVMTLADLQGMEYARSATPEYLRAVETGGLRSFAGQTPVISAMFTGMVCVIAYGLGHAAARFFVFWPFGKFVKRLP